MKTAGDIPDGYAVQILTGKVVTVRYVRSTVHGTWSRATERDSTHGHVIMSKSPVIVKWGTCSKAFVVTSSNVKKGWGPLLYDVAMEYATKHGGGLTPDRSSVSDDARKVWKVYASRSDVKVVQLDDLKNTLTRKKGDNCDMYAASKKAEMDWTKATWQRSPLSKRYLKPNGKVTKALKAAGKLIIK